MSNIGKARVNLTVALIKFMYLPSVLTWFQIHAHTDGCTHACIHTHTNINGVVSTLSEIKEEPRSQKYSV